MKKIIFNKAFFAGLAKKHGLYSTMFKNLGHGHDTEIIVEDKYFDRLVQIQNKFESFCAMGDDERRAFYLIVPRPSPVVPESIPLDDRDIYYYSHSHFKQIDDNLDVDSPDDFNKFAVDHYAELGFSRLNIFASTFHGTGWKLVVSSSYSAYADTAIDVAVALYKAGAPLYIRYADRYLQLIREEGNVRFVSCPFHDYMSHHEEASVMTLPSEYQCRKYPEEGINLEQYEQIVSSAHWEEEERLSLL